MLEMKEKAIRSLRRLNYLINAVDSMRDEIREMKNAAYGDAVEVVRCRDCEVPHNKFTGCPNLNGLVTPPDFYCPFGERTMTGMAEYIEREAAIAAIMSEPPDAHYPDWYVEKIKAIPAAGERGSAESVKVCVTKRRCRKR